MRQINGIYGDSHRESIQEHWTASRQGVVLVGTLEAIREVCSRLKLPDDIIIRLSQSRSAVGLWGEYLIDYLTKSRTTA